MDIRRIAISLGTVALCVGAVCQNPHKAQNVVDEVAWVIGDEAIFRSEVEKMYAQQQQEGVAINGDPYCVIPEQIAVQKLYLHQAKIDTIEAPESQVRSSVEKRINFFIANLGSKEKVEEYFRKDMPSIKEDLLESTRTYYIMDEVQRSLTKNVKATPNDVRRYFNNLEEDSVPYVPMTVEVQIITINPTVPQQEIEDVKAQLRDYTERVNRGDADFSTLAIMYSEDKGSAMQGGELGFHGRADFVPEFSNVAFNLNDPKRVSRIVETEFGFHIIQLIEKRGDQVNVRHILRSPKVSSSDLETARLRLDTLAGQIRNNEIPFDQAARYVSQDKDSRNNKGIMVNQMTGGTRFEMQQLPVEVARQIENMEVGQISDAFIMKDERKNRDQVAVVRLMARVPGHRATLSDDYNLVKQMYEDHAREEILKKWVEKKIKETYVKIEDGWNNCDFRYEGWVK